MLAARTRVTVTALVVANGGDFYVIRDLEERPATLDGLLGCLCERVGAQPLAFVVEIILDGTLAFGQRVTFLLVGLEGIEPPCLRLKGGF
jgi:hypothetical protein